MFTISKTDYLIYRECKKNAWLKLHKPEIYYKNELSDFDKSIIETGNEVEDYARQLFPTGILIEGRDIVAQKKTAALIESMRHKQNKDTNVIFQPVFERDNLLAALDVLQYESKTDSFNILEIKASNAVKDKLHLYDLAFQVNLIKRCRLQLGTANILHLNPDFIRNGELDITKLFTITNVTEDVSEIAEKVDLEMTQALEYLSSNEEPAGFCDCIYKGRSSHCTTFHYSNPDVPEYSVHDIARIGLSKKKLMELIDSNIFHIKDIPEHIDLSEIQRNQVDAHIRDRSLIKNDKIKEELASLQYPLYFIDYETFPSAIPLFDGFSPYQQIPFQYSLHIVESAKQLQDKSFKPIHKEFLHTGSDDPSFPFIESMMKDIGKIGSIIVWNKKFECKINEELAKRLSKQKSESESSSKDSNNIRNFIGDVNSRVYDLMDIFAKQHYVHKDFYGSTSIKYVLPVIAEMIGEKTNLSYKELEIREGGTASMKWNEMSTGFHFDQETSKKIPLSQSERDKIAKNLRKYCKLDTYAMYAIWKHLMEL